VINHLAGFAIAVDQAIARRDVGAVMRRALAGAEQQDVAGLGPRAIDFIDARMNGSASRPSSETMKGTRCAIRPETKATSRESRSNFETKMLQRAIWPR
jgi:hypothetical protein